jgi:hypothetical protein
MQSYVRSYLYFNALLLWRTQPIAVVVSLFSVGALALAWMALVQQWAAAESVRNEWREIDKRVRISERSLQVASSEPSLPAFSGNQFVNALYRISTDSKLPLDEVVFALDDNGNQPYLRYRATLAVTATFPVIRAFIVQLHGVNPDVSLDAVSCARADIATEPLSCELTLSAFYRRPAAGG